jgi:hypothetical protein
MNHVSNSDAAWIAFAGLFPVVLYLIYSGYQTKQRMAVRRAVIDKFTSAQDFAAFLQSPGGQRFVADLSGSESPARTVMAAIQRGIVLALLGAGVWWAGVKIQSTAELATLGLLLVCVGIGILVSAAISYWLSKSWGLIGQPPYEERTKSTGM